jgi:hypothetical protein
MTCLDGGLHGAEGQRPDALKAPRGRQSILNAVGEVDDPVDVADS